MARERERLPEEQKRLLDERIVHNKALEGALIDREASLKSEESRRLVALEQRSREMMQELSRHRLQVEQDLADEK